MPSPIRPATERSRLRASTGLLLTCLTWAWMSSAAAAGAEDVQVRTNLTYKEAASTDYEVERCRLDVYLPAGAKGFPTLVWFHGGGLEQGTKDDAFTRAIAMSLARSGLAVAAANYRLSPKATYPAYVEDAAAAVAWTLRRIAEHGGDPRRVFVGGHSAGGYLTLMVGMDPRYLAAHGRRPADLAGLIPVSGQTMTHYTIRTERGLPKAVVIADDAAPVHHARADVPPVLLLYAERDLPARVEENTYLAALLRAAGHTNLTQQLIADRDHGSVAARIKNEDDPARAALLRFVETTPGAPHR